MGGSSTGGYISLVAFYAPRTFKKILALSNTIWFNEDAIKGFIEASGFYPGLTIYMEVGTNESSNSDMTMNHFVCVSSRVISITRPIGNSASQMP